MTGWKTWVAGLGMIGWGIGGAVAGMHSPDEAMQICLQGMAVLGVGHKIEKMTNELRGN